MNIRTLFLAVTTLLLSLTAHAQVTTVPAFPTLENPLTITFDATQGNGELAGFTGDVYAHTGVLTNLSAGPSSWRYVIAPWETNLPKAKLTRVGTDLYELEIPNIREYYGVPASEEILQLAFVFRSADRTREGKGPNRADIFVTIYEGELVVRFDSPSTSPYFPAFVDAGSDVDVSVVASSSLADVVRIELFADDVSVAVVEDSESLTHTLTAGTSGRTNLRAVATDELGDAESTETYFIVRQDAPQAARPAGIRDGVNYHSNGSTVTFSMFAPGKQFVHVIGDFTDWEVSNDFVMNKYEVNADSVHFWLEVDGLTPGQEYRFQYLVDGNIRIADLFSEKILDPDLDRFITSSVYPDLIAYPRDMTSGVVTVIKPGRTPFNWQTNDFQRPPQDQLVIYELLLRDFVEESTFDVLRDTLGYLERLGINAIELMPVSNFDGNLSWGYNPNFHGALDKSYGTRESFKRFVDEAHSRGMAVILDVVYNHSQEKSPLVALYGTNPANNRFLGPGHDFSVFRHLNHNDPYIRYWLDRMNRYWIETYRVDGYRFDLTKGFATNFNSSNYHGYNSQRIGNLKRMADAVWAFDQSAYLILEHFAADSEERELAHYRTNEEGINGMMFWQGMTTGFQEVAMGWQGSNSNISNIWFRNRNWNVPNAIPYMESHDEQWMMFKNLRYGNSSGSYSVRELPTALQRQQMAGALFFMVPGPRMMWQFGELGYGGGDRECLKPGDNSNGECLPSDPGRTSEKPVRWDYYDDPNRFELYQVWSALINLRREQPVFHDVSTQVTTSLNPGAVRQVRMVHSTMSAVVVANSGVTTVSANVQFPSTGMWYDYFTGQEIDITANSTSISMAPGQFNIYTTEPLPTPEIIRATSIDDMRDNNLPATVALHSNFPNPFNPTTTLRYDLPENMRVTMTVYDILGREVATLVNSEMPAGSHTVQFDAGRLSSGTYMVRMQAGDAVHTRKMMLVK